MSRRETYHAPLRDREEAGRIVVSVRPTSKLASFAIAGTVNSVLTGQAIPADSDTTLPRGKLPTRIPAKHQLLLAALRKLGKPVTNEWSGGI